MDDLVKAVLSGEIELKSLSKEQLEAVESALRDTKEQMAKSDEVEEVLKIDANGQWSMEKAIKPGPALNYKNINKPVRIVSEEDATTIDYSSGTPEISGRQWKTSDTKNQGDRTKVPQKTPRQKRVADAIRSGKVIP